MVFGKRKFSNKKKKKIKIFNKGKIIMTLKIFLI